MYYLFAINKIFKMTLWLKNLMPEIFSKINLKFYTRSRLQLNIYAYIFNIYIYIYCIYIEIHNYI